MPFTTGGDSALLQLNAGDFDFNVQFEQLFFSIVPSVLFVVLSLWQTMARVRKPAIVDAPGFQLLKLGATTIYVGLELALVVLVAVGSVQVSRLFVAASVLQLLDALLIVVLSLVDHSRSPRPSVLLSSYLVLTLLLDAAQARTLFLSASHDKKEELRQSTSVFRTASLPERTYSSVFVAAMAAKAAILVIEAQQKSRWVRWRDEKPHSPEETSGIFSLGVFFWLNRLFLVGYRKVMAVDDLYPLDSALAARPLHEAFARNWEGRRRSSSGSAHKNEDQWALVKALVRTLLVPLLLPVLPRLALLVFTLCQPLFLKRLLDYLQEDAGDSKEATRQHQNVGNGLIGAAFCIYAGIALSTALLWYLHQRVRTMAASILITQTYQQATRARLGGGDGRDGGRNSSSGSGSGPHFATGSGSGSESAKEKEAAPGTDKAAVTLMSTDIERIRVGIRDIHELWASFVQAGVASYLLYRELGVVFVAPIGLMLLCMVGLALTLRAAGDSQRVWMTGVQKRVGLTAAVVAGMKSLKIAGLTDAVAAYVQQLRVDELAAGARFRTVFIVAALLGYIPRLFAPPLTFACGALGGISSSSNHRLDASTLFTSLTYLTLLTTPLGQIFQTLPRIVSALACLGRIQAFLLCETRDDFRVVRSDRTNEETAENQEHQENQEKPRVGDDDNDYPLVVENGTFGWQAGQPPVLRGISVCFPRGALTMVVGPVGAGKSTLCKALLGEIPVRENGTRVLLDKHVRHVAFCEQTPFLFNGPIRDNIVGFAPWDAARYAAVLQATALGVDLAALPRGDRTNIGSDGIALSGGQKQRVSLARALYLDSDLLILDDVFSGLDADTEAQVFRQVFAQPDGLLRRRGATAVLCTHSVRHLPAADHIVALSSEGTVAEQGTFAELMGRGEGGYVQQLGVKEGEKQREKEDDNGEGPSDRDGNNNDNDNNITEDAAALVRLATTHASAVGGPEGDKARMTGDKSVYKHYIQSMGWLVAISALLCGACWGFFVNFSTVWLTFWTNDVYSDHPSHSYGYYAGIYAALQLCAVVALLLLAVGVFITSVKRAGAHLHQEALTTLVRAPLQFFTKTDTGVVTNLFSQDLNLIDTELPEATLNMLFSSVSLTGQTFIAIGQAAVMLTSSPYLAASYPLVVGLLYVVQKFYLRTSRQLRLLDLETKSPLYTHFLDTIKGIVTIRALGFLPDEIEKSSRLLDATQRPAYLLLMIQSWLTLVLDLVVLVMAVALTTLAVRLHSSAGFAGASLFSLLSFGDNLSGIVIFYTQLETSIGAIARLRTFHQTVQPEDQPGEDVVPPLPWPHGAITLDGVSASYDAKRQEEETADDGGSSPQANSSPEPTLALADIHLSIRPGEKVAVCGRTGSGKSSLVALLLKLLDPWEDKDQGSSSVAGAATLDNTPLARINRSALRQRLIAVPQEAVFLSDGATFQENLDPAGTTSGTTSRTTLRTTLRTNSAAGASPASAADCQSVLEAVGLWTFVQARGGLTAGMHPASLSAGQRQLMSLGRALLRRKARQQMASGDHGILLLDEVSSSVDQETERTMQAIIRQEFADYTVIAIAHRLDMIMDFDRVVVMDQGRIVEEGHPRVLAADGAGTRFGDLVRAGGATSH